MTYTKLPVRLPLPGVRKIFAVASGKGGVGKSTVAVNLALAVSRLQKQCTVGILDADIYGPSIPKMMNLCGKPEVNHQGLMMPLTNFNIKCLSMGLLSDENQPIVWRGLIVMSAVQTLLRKVVWGPLDYLFIDTPPGTGDVHLSLSQNIPIDGAIIVTTCQDVALLDARKGTEMFRKFKPPIPVLGFVENMSYITCSKCGEHLRPFGSGEKLRALAQEQSVDILGRIPFESHVVTACDVGKPIVIGQPDSIVSKAFLDVAEAFIKRIPGNT